MFQRQYFQQEEPHLGNQFTEDSVLIEALTRTIPHDILSQVDDDLKKFGLRCSPSGDIVQFGYDCEQNPPRLIRFNAFGRRVDDIKVDRGWDRMKDISAEEGLVSIGYQREFGEYSRTVQMVKLFLFSGVSNVFTCPLAMTDGASRVLELYMDTVRNQSLRDELKEAFQNFTSTDPEKFWTSGQWMTERTGGSDVGSSETIAYKNEHDGSYSLHGYKFFTSATTSEGALTLAKIVPDGSSEVPKGSRNLSLFFVHMRKKDGDLNNIIVHRLKDKLGTKAVPTAELELVGSRAILIGNPGDGVKQISNMLNITRLYAGMGGVSAMRVSLALARDYASRRSVFGKLLKDQPLHLSALAAMEVEYRASMQFFINITNLLGLVETGMATESQTILLRLLCPLFKGYISKSSTHMVIEGMESFGGIGYLEDSNIPLILRNQLVNIIWEGTTNVLSLDVWRAISRENALHYFTQEISTRLNRINSQLSSEANILVEVLGQVNEFVVTVSSKRHVLESTARQLLLTLAKLYMALVLLEQASHTLAETDIHAFHLWTESGINLLTPLEDINNRITLNEQLALDSHRGNKYTTNPQRPKF